MAELVIPIREYIGKSEWNWETGEFEWATNADDVRMMVEWAQYDGMTVDSICLEIGVCFGGCTFTGKDIYHYLQGLNIPIRTRIYSFAASMATILMLVGDECEIDASAQILVHGPSGGASGTVTQVQSDLKLLTNEHQALRDIYVARTGQSADVVDEWMSKDTFLTASEALALGLVTKVIPIAPKTAPTLTTAQASARRAKYAGIVARADKRTVRALLAPKPKAAAKRPAATISPKPMAKKVIPIAQAVGKKTAAPTAQQAANIAAVQAFAKQLGVKATIEGADVNEVTAEAQATVLADGAGTLYTDGPLAVDSAVFNDEAMTEATADGVYGAQDGRDITIAEGIVTELTDASAEGDDETPAAGLSSEEITAAVTAALAPLTKRLDDMEGKVTAFSKTVPPTPRPAARAAGTPQVDAKTSNKPKPKGLLAGASAAKD